MTQHAPVATVSLATQWDHPVHLDMGYPKGAIISPRGVTALGPEWDVPGVYILIWGHGPAGTPTYVGKAIKSLRQRVKDHVTGKPAWHRAVLLRRADAFTGSQSGWLEGHLIDRLKQAPFLDVTNKSTPHDEHLPAHEVQALHQFIEPMLAMLRLAGANPDGARTAATAPVVVPPHTAPRPEGAPGHLAPPASKRPAVPATTKRKQGPARFPADWNPSRTGTPVLGRYVTDGSLLAGTTLTARFKGEEHHVTVDTEGRLHLPTDTDPFPSPSTAASMITRRECNGWEFWRLPDGRPLSALRRD